MDRDLVQFVRYLDFAGPAASARLAQETLKELPEQMLGFFKTRGIRPDPRPGSAGAPDLAAAGKSVLQAAFKGN